MDDGKQRMCPRCPHPYRAHTARPPRTVYCRDCDCGWRTTWTAAWAVGLLWFADRMMGWLHDHE